MKQECSYRYPTSTCTNRAIVIKYQAYYNEKTVNQRPLCKSHLDRSAHLFDTEEEAWASLTTARMA